MIKINKPSDDRVMGDLRDVIVTYTKAKGLTVDEKAGKISILGFKGIPEGAEPPTYWIHDGRQFSSGWLAVDVMERIIEG